MKQILQAIKSRTVLLAATQAALGLLVLILTEADFVAAAMMVKSIADIILRYDTKEPMWAK